jgi:sec-independent protein translocase protein TatA
MGGTSIWHWIVVGLIVVLLFGRGKISDMMGDVAKGIKSFKKGMTEDEEAEARRLTDGGTVQATPVQASPVQPAPVRPVTEDRPAAAQTVDARPVDARPVDPVVTPQDADRRQP